MAITYLDVVNEVLHDTNEVPLTDLTFTQDRGFHTFVKKAVNRALMDIVIESEEWPWLANVTRDPHLSVHTNQLFTDRRKAVYDMGADISAADWDSFVIEDVQTKQTYPLESVQLEQWKEYRANDAKLNREEKDLGRPCVIYRTPDHTGFALSPTPDKAYRISYITWKAPEFLVNATDTLPFPDRFYTVLVHRARYYAWNFRENKDQSTFARADYDQGLRNMKRILIRPAFQRMRPV